MSSKSDAVTAANGVRRIYEQRPYPDIPLDEGTQYGLDWLFFHNLVTPFYIRDQVVISTKDRTILDAGCGTGLKSRFLAEANPRAHVVGIDFSSRAIEIARRDRVDHGVVNSDFRVFRIEDLPQLGEPFDYINCDEVMYLLPDPIGGLRALVSVLKPHGIMRLNFHSFRQRQAYYRAQEACRLLGIFEAPSVAEQIVHLGNFMTSLHPVTDLKVKTQWREVNDAEEMINNQLLNGDRGSTIPEVFGYLQSAGLHFISMVDWRSWELGDSCLSGCFSKPQAVVYGAPRPAFPKALRGP
jgi:2-polyprenyl-3-methyl-5-hydroxy-6-metoxy-1,4-benzoquinol methylase